MSSFLPWQAGQPNNAGYGANGYNYEDCVAKFHGANGLFDINCATTYAFMCKEMSELPAERRWAAWLPSQLFSAIWGPVLGAAQRHTSCARCSVICQLLLV
jgi:hypothetical protein